MSSCGCRAGGFAKLVREMRGLHFQNGANVRSGSYFVALKRRGVPP